MNKVKKIVNFIAKTNLKLNDHMKLFSEEK